MPSKRWTSGDSDVPMRCECGWTGPRSGAVQRVAGLALACFCPICLRAVRVAALSESRSCYAKQEPVKNGDPT